MTPLRERIDAIVNDWLPPGTYDPEALEELTDRLIDEVTSTTNVPADPQWTAGAAVEVQVRPAQDGSWFFVPVAGNHEDGPVSETYAGPDPDTAVEMAGRWFPGVPVNVAIPLDWEPTTWEPEPGSADDAEP